MSEIAIPAAFRELFQPGWRDFAAFGGRGGAKSHSVAGALVIQAAQAPLRVVCAREIQESLRDSVKQLIEDKISDFGLADHFEALRDETRAKNGGRFVYKGMWRNPDALKSLEGADVFWGEEANRFSARSIRLIRPTLRKPNSRMIWTWNPEFDHDPIDQMFRGPAGPPPNSLVREVSWRDNPWFADTPLLGEMEHDYRADPQRAAHVWGGAYVSAIDGAYYAAQLLALRDEGRITALAKDPILRLRAFWDLGRRDATAIWIAQFVGREIRVLGYVEGRGQELSYYINQLRSGGWGDALCVLPHDGRTVTLIAPGSAEEQLRAAGFETQIIANQGKGAALQRVAAARRLFPRIWVNDTPDLAPGLKALAAYHERRDEDRNVGLGPEHDWCFTGDTKVLTRYGTQRIDSLPEAGEIMTPCGWNRYRNPRVTRRRAQLVGVTFSDGLTVRCTPDHLFLTASGWICAERLVPNTLIQSCSIRSPNTLMAAFTEYGRAVRILRAAASLYTETLGLTLTDLFRQVAIFITEMATRRTIYYRILSAWTPSTIFRTPGIYQRADSHRANTSVKQPEKRLQNGTDLKKVGFGISATPNRRKAGRSGEESLKTVLHAVLSLMLLCVKAAIAKFTARRSVRSLHIGIGNLVTSGPRRIEIVKRLNETADVWCMTVPDGDTFALSNGAFVHNCSDPADAWGLMCVAYEEPTPGKQPDRLIIPAFGAV